VDVRITTGRTVADANVVGEKLRLRLDDGTVRTVDHALLATGYKVDVKKYPFLPPDVRDSLVTTNGLPRLSRGFESSIPGLFFVGASAAWSYGPLMRFVAGTEFTAPVLTRAIHQRLR
jgi:hypothetical protein